MLLPRKTSGAIRANAGTAAKAERAEGGRPQVGGLLLQPALDVGKGFGFRRGFGRHAVCMPHHIHTCQGKNIKMHETLFGKSRVSLISCGDLSFAPETSLSGALPCIHFARNRRARCYADSRIVDRSHSCFRTFRAMDESHEYRPVSAAEDKVARSKAV